MLALVSGLKASLHMLYVPESRSKHYLIRQPLKQLNTSPSFYVTETCSILCLLRVIDIF